MKTNLLRHLTAFTIASALVFASLPVSSFAEDAKTTATSEVQDTEENSSDENVPYEQLPEDAAHFADNGGIREMISTGTHTFETSSFSEFTANYTVDFSYEGYTYSMDGSGQVFLSKLSDELGLYTYEENKTFSVKDVREILFTDNNLINIEKQDNGDWLLTSLTSFTSEETLVIKMNDGTRFEIAVTDPPSDDSSMDPAYNPKGEITFSGKMTLENKVLFAGEFTFELYDSEGTQIDLVFNEDDGSYCFQKIEYTGEDLNKDDDGNFVETTKTYKVVQKAGEESCVTYDDTVYEIEVTLKDNGEGTIVTSADPAEDSYDFTNIYNTSGEITFEGKKTLKNRKPAEKEFSFELYDEDGNLLETVTNGADGSYNFTTIEYTGDDLERDSAGNYLETIKNYRVAEKAGEDSSVTYDDTEYEITVTLTDNGKGTIMVTADPAEDSYDFTNIYNTKGNTVIGGVKVLEGRELKDGEFTFELKDENGDVVKEAVNDADGNFSFEELEFTGEDLDTDADGNYIKTIKTYTVVEKAGSDTAITYDGSEYTVELTLTDEGNGSIKVVKNPEDAAAQTFTNIYEGKGEVAFGGKKTLEDRALTEGEFSFELKDAEGDVLETVTNDADGSYSFTTIKYTLEDLDKDGGKYIPTEKVYTVGEVRGEDENIEYDDNVYTITCVLTDAGNNTVEVTTDEVPGACDFTNTYKTKGEITFSGKKTLENRALFAGEFTFELYDSEGTQIDLVFNEDDGSYSFSKIEYTGDDLDKDGDGNFVETTKTYRVVEKAGDDSSLTYDGTEYEITVTLKDDGKGTIAASADPMEDTYDFTNTYKTKGEITFTGTKELQNRKLTGGEFSFELYDEDGNLLETVANAADGSYSFSKIEYTGDDLKKDSAGNYIETIKAYRVVEKAGEDSSLTYDKTEYEITVTLKDDGKGTIAASADPAEDSYDFTNIYNTSGEITFSGKKNLENRKSTEGEFSFELYETNGESEKLLQTVTNAADGSYSFSKIEYTGDDLDKDGDGNFVETTKTYKVVEKAGEDSSLTYDKTEYEITVTLKDDGKGTIAASADPAENSYDFTNIYNTRGEITFSGKKTLENRKPAEGEFSFELYETNGESEKLLETVTNAADGSYSFKTIEYNGDDLDKDAEGYYIETARKYKIVEKAGTLKGVTYDTTKYDITVTLKDDGKGTINVMATPDKSTYNFTNEYEATGKTDLKAKMAITGASWPEGGKVTFTVTAANGVPMPEKPTVSLTAAGDADFGSIKYTIGDAGKTYTYTIKETSGFGSGWTAVPDKITVTVVVGEDNGDGTLKECCSPAN